MTQIIVADAGANHLGDRKLMAAMVREAARVGIDVFKVQSWQAKHLRRDWPDYENAVEYYRKHELTPEDHVFLLERCIKNNIEFLATAFDLEAVDFLAGLGLQRVKVASPDCNRFSLIGRCLEQFDHVIISTGMHTWEEVLALRDFLGSAVDQVTVMHCVSLYPTPPDQVNMLRLAKLMGLFPSVGYSDHTLGTNAGKLALALGVACLERHYALNRFIDTKDIVVSSTPDEFMELVEWRASVQKMMVSLSSCLSEQELVNRKLYKGKWGEV